MEERNGEFPKRLVVSAGDKFKRIEIDETAYFFADDKYVFAVGQDGRRQLIDQTLEELGSLLDPKVFFRLNRRYLARENSICDVERFFNRRLHVKLEPATRRPRAREPAQGKDVSEVVGRLTIASLLPLAALLLLTTCKRPVVVVESVPPNTPKGSRLYLSGDFNHWDPADERFALQPVGDSVWLAPLPPGRGAFNFHVTRGDRSTVEAGTCGEVVVPRRFAFGSDTLRIAVASWSDLEGGELRPDHARAATAPGRCGGGRQRSDRRHVQRVEHERQRPALLEDDGRQVRRDDPPAGHDP